MEPSTNRRGGSARRERARRRLPVSAPRGVGGCGRVSALLLLPVWPTMPMYKVRPVHEQPGSVALAEHLPTCMYRVRNVHCEGGGGFPSTSLPHQVGASEAATRRLGLGGGLDRAGPSGPLAASCPRHTAWLGAAAALCLPGEVGADLCWRWGSSCLGLGMRPPPSKEALARA